MRSNKRVFIAIQIGSKIKSIYGSEIFFLINKLQFIKPVLVENTHITLSFIGHINDQEIIEIIKLLKNNIFMDTFLINIEGTGIFSLNKSKKILWLGINKGVKNLKKLHKQINQCIHRYKKYENNIFKPHITIASIKNSFMKNDVLPLMNAVYSPIEIEVNSISLYQSKLAPNGAEYSIIKQFPLNRGGDFNGG